MKNDNSNITKKQLGAIGEQLAEQWLIARGYRILARNWRVRTGELDLIVQDGEILVFIEVRTRSSTHAFGLPQESIDARKQMKLRQTAQLYIHRNQLFHMQARFDIMGIVLSQDQTEPSIEHTPNAF